MTQKKKLVFNSFVYQIIIESQHMVIVCSTLEEAQEYVEDAFKGTAVLILPIAVFNYHLQNV